MTIRHPRRWFALYLIFLGLLSTCYAFHHMRLRDPFAMGDFLINYTAGFIRRGLLGEFIRQTSHLTHINPLILAFLIQAAAFITFLIVVFQLTNGLRFTYALTALLLSPATLAFMALNPAQSMRKEILLYAVLSLYCLPFITRLRDWQIITSLTLLAPALILTHDSLAIFMPYLAAIIILQRTTDKLTGLAHAMRLMILPALASIAACIAIATHYGNLAMATTICNSLGGNYQLFGPYQGNLCAGGIMWLQVTLPQAHQFTQTFIATQHYYRIYLPLIPLVFAPIAILLHQLYRRNLHREVNLILACTLTTFVGSAFLWYSTVDWGRWISMHAICLMLLILVASRRAPQPTPEPLTPTRRLSAPLAVALYATIWALPPTILNTNRTGYVGLYQYFRDTHQHQPS